MMRLIDADELRKCVIPCEIHNGASTDLCVPLYQIDNAPTIGMPKALGTVDENGNIKIELIRPQGEWITQEGYDGDEYYECSVCKDAFVLMEGTPKENNYNFCPNCGADMRGGVK